MERWVVHELGVALEIVERAEERAEGARVTKVRIEVGVLTAIFPDALGFCFDLATAGTCVEGAQLEVVQPKARARCRSCDQVVELDAPYGRCACGDFDLDWLTGSELRIVEMEVA